MPRFSPRSLRAFAVGFLAAEALSATAWWVMLGLFPPSRRFFLPPDLPDYVLLAFFAPDVLLFIGAAVGSAIALARGSSNAWGLLCLHLGGVVYATLFTFALAWWGGGGWAGALLMTPCAVAVSLLVWWLRLLP